jgi:hypothetical protein
MQANRRWVLPSCEIDGAPVFYKPGTLEVETTQREMDVLNSLPEVYE